MDFTSAHVNTLDYRGAGKKTEALSESAFLLSLPKDRSDLLPRICRLEENAGRICTGSTLTVFHKTVLKKCSLQWMQYLCIFKLFLIFFNIC